MKSNKLAVSLALAALILVAGSFILNGSDTAQAQVKPISPWDPIFFGEDPMRQHALQIRSAYANVIGTVDMLEVPQDKNFILTDVYRGFLGQVVIGGGSPPQSELDIRDNLTPHTRFKSGIPFGPGMVTAYCPPGSGNFVTISGYYVDL